MNKLHVAYIMSIAEEGDLDELVHDTCSQDASNINNSGAWAEYVETHGLEETEDMDDAVHSAHERLASQINNGGVSSQAEFLLDSGYTLDYIDNYIREQKEQDA